MSSDVLNELTALADSQLLDVNNQQPLAGLFHSANTLYLDGLTDSSTQNIENAYVKLLRYVTFVIKRLPKHRQFQLGQFDEMRSESRAQAANAMAVLEQLKQQIRVKYDGAPMASPPSDTQLPPPSAPASMGPKPSAPKWNE